MLTLNGLPAQGFLAEASPALRAVLSEGAEPIRLKAGETLFSEGDTGDALFAVISGRLDLSVLAVDGRRFGLDLLHPGDVFGEVALFDPGPRTATVTAREASQLLRLRHKALKELLAASPEMAADMLHLMGGRIRAMSGQLSDQVFLPLAPRLARRLLHLSDADQRLMMSRADLAEHAGATREAVTKVLTGWRRAGMISMGRGWIQILDGDRLARELVSK